MISQEQLQKIVEQKVSEKLAGNPAGAAEPSPEPQVEEKKEPSIKTLDEVDAVRLENLLLQQEIEKLRQEVENQRREFAQKELMQKQIDLQSFLVDKYEVDTEENTLQINPKTRELVITPK